MATRQDARNAFAPTLPYEMFTRALKRFADRPCLTMGDDTLTFADVDRASTRLAQALSSRGVGHRDAVALYLRNGFEVVIADMAIIKLGAVRTPLNEMLSASDIAYMLEFSEAKALIAHSSFADNLITSADAVSDVEVRLCVADDGDLEGFESYDGALAAASGDFPDRPPLALDDPHFIGFTGGTTGRSKGVVHQMAPMGINLMCHTMTAEIAADDHLLIHSPIAHAAGLFVQTALVMGARTTIMSGFDPAEMLRLVEDAKITWTFMVPTMIYRVLDHPDLARRDTSSMRTIFYGAAPITSSRLQQGIDAFGLVFKQLYGQTEAPNFICALEKADHLKPELQRSCGQPTVFCEVLICDDQGAEVPLGEVGEITVRSPFTLAGYYKEPEKTADAHWGEWLRTGDVGYQAESGHVFLVDRSKDMIISGGMNVYSTEVEDVVQRHPMVGQVVVIGLPDEDWGEAVTAFVVPAPGDFDPDAVLAFAKEELAKYKTPKRVIQIDAVPVTAYGKANKKALRKDYWGDHDRAIN